MKIAFSCRNAMRALMAACLAASLHAHAESGYPAKPITLIVPMAPGGSTDSTARLLAEELRTQLNQPILVENLSGASGNIASLHVARATPDGYTLLFASSTIAANVSLFKSQPFKLERDLVAISQVSLIPNVLIVNNSVPAKDLASFIQLVKSKSMPLSYGSGGNGASQHLSGALLNHKVGGSMTHIPYRGGSLAVADLVGGHIEVYFSPLVEALPFIETGKVRALGVTTPTRSKRLPDVPAIAEQLPGFQIELWNGLFAPAGTPPDIVAKLGNAVHAAMQSPRIRKSLEEQGTVPVGSSPAEFRNFLSTDIPTWTKLVEISGATVQ